MVFVFYGRSQEHHANILNLLVLKRYHYIERIKNGESDFRMKVIKISRAIVRERESLNRAIQRDINKHPRNKSVGVISISI